MNKNRPRKTRKRNWSVYVKNPFLSFKKSITMELLLKILDQLKLKLIKKYVSQSQHGLSYDLRDKKIPIKIYINNANPPKEIYWSMEIHKPTARNIQYWDPIIGENIGIAIAENEYTKENTRNALIEQIYLQLKKDGFVI